MCNAAKKLKRINKNQVNNMDDSEELSLKDDNFKTMTPMELYKKSFGDLSQAPYDLWLLFIIKFCLYGSLSTFLSALPIYITEVHEMSDTELSIIYMILGLALITLIPLLGSFTDRYGICPSLAIGSFLGATSFTLIIFIEDVYLQLIVMLTVAMVGIALAAPSLEVGVKYYTHMHYRSLAISFYTAITYLSLMVGGGVIELLLVYGNKDQSTFKILFLYCAICCAVSFILSLFLRQLDYEYHEEQVQSLQKAGMRSNWQHVREILILKKFWRYFIVVMMVLIIKTIFYQQSIALPLYMYRDLGDDSHYGLSIVINQLLIIITVPIFSYSIYYYTAYEIFLISGLIAVLSPLPFIFGANYYTIMGYIVISSISESLFSPRLLEYALELSPKGKEGIMIAIAALPSALSLVFAGIIGGVLLNSFCPEDGEQKCWLMWMIIAGIGFVPVLILFIFRKCLDEPKFESQPYVSCSREADFCKDF